MTVKLTEQQIQEVIDREDKVRAILECLRYGLKLDGKDDLDVLDLVEAVLDYLNENYKLFMPGL
ncbi:MAG: hypothetical protein LUG49_05890 [Oscillospiraceae bacterium]|nr:hypothetical protein [Oscillospiraceae bacterium]